MESSNTNDIYEKVYYSDVEKECEGYIYQYRVTISKEEFYLDYVKCKDEDISDEIDDLIDDEMLEDQILEEEVIKSIVKIPLPSALIKMQNGIDLRIKDLKTKFTDRDVLSELYLDILE
jgi:hypothetical protein